MRLRSETSPAHVPNVKYRLTNYQEGSAGMSDNWDFYVTTIDESPASVFLDLQISSHLLSDQDIWLLFFWVRFRRPDRNGFPVDEEAMPLYDLESDAVENLQAQSIPVEYVGRITGLGRREFYFYGPGTAKDGFLAVIQATLQKFPVYEVEFGANEDPECSHYSSVMYPSEMEIQQIRVRRSVARLEELGDPLTVPREVHHWLSFTSETTRDAFAMGISRQGFAIKQKFSRQTDEQATQYWLVIARSETVDLESIQQTVYSLVTQATTFGATYDGWESPVVA
jgi:hypothetical protein